MNLESQVTNLELSKRLNEIRFKKDSYFAWFNKPLEGKWEVSTQTKNVLGLPAYTASELLEMLPSNHANFYKSEEGYIFSIHGEPNVIEKNFSNCCAKILIHLIEKKLIEV